MCIELSNRIKLVLRFSLILRVFSLLICPTKI